MFVYSISGEMPCINCVVAITEQKLNERPIKTAIIVLGNETITQDHMQLGENRGCGGIDELH